MKIVGYLSWENAFFPSKNTCFDPFIIINSNNLQKHDNGLLLSYTEDKTMLF